MVSYCEVKNASQVSWGVEYKKKILTQGPGGNYLFFKGVCEGSDKVSG